MHVIGSTSPGKSLDGVLWNYGESKLHLYFQAACSVKPNIEDAALLPLILMFLYLSWVYVYALFRTYLELIFF